MAVTGKFVRHRGLDRDRPQHHMPGAERHKRGQIMAICGKHASLTAAALTLSALAACAAPPPPGLGKPGADAFERTSDLTECERFATGAEMPNFRALNQTYEEARDEIPRRRAECLRARGWREER